MKLETEFTTADFVILKTVKKMKNNKFFEEKRNFFGFGKILSTQTSNLAICLNIYVGICCLPTKIARITKGNVWRWLY